MDAPGTMYHLQMLLLLLLMGVSTFWLGRILQWLLFRKNFTGRKIFFILLGSLLASYLFALLIWFLWHPTEPMWSIFCLPVVLAELIVLTFTIIVFKRKKHT